jgi:hypothetical protein
MMHPASVDGQALLYDQPQFMIENFIKNMTGNFIFMPKKDIFVGTV